MKGRLSMAKRVSAAEAKATLSELMARVAYGGEKFVIERRGKPVAALVAIDDLQRIEAAIPQPGPELGARHGALALQDAWAEVPDEEIDAIFEEVVASRARQATRPVPPLD